MNQLPYVCPEEPPLPSQPLPLPPPGRLLLRRGRHRGRAAGGAAGPCRSTARCSTCSPEGECRRAAWAGIGAAGPAQPRGSRGRAAPAGPGSARRCGAAPAARGVPGSAAWQDGEPPCGTGSLVQQELARDAGQGKRGAEREAPRGLFSGANRGASMCSGARPALSIGAWLRFLCDFSGFK